MPAAGRGADQTQALLTVPMGPPQARPVLAFPGLGVGGDERKTEGNEEIPERALGGEGKGSLRS